MTARTYGWLAPLALALAVLLAPVGWADSYTDQLAAQFGPTQHVLADPAAKPALQNADQLNQQILATGKPIYVAAVAAAQTGSATPNALHSALLARLGRFEGVILVIDSAGYHVRAYSVPAAIANSVDPLLHQAAAEHRNDPYGATSAFVSKLAGVHAPTAGAPVRAAHAPKKSGSLTWLWVLLAVGGGGLLVWVWRVRARRQRERQALRERVEQDLISVEPDVNDLAEAVVAGNDVDVSAESNKALLSFSAAQSAFQAGNFSAAAAHVNNVRAAVREANLKRNPLNVDAVQSVPEADRKQGSVRVNNPTSGQPVVINNNDYRTNPTSGYGNYYGGGMYNGMYFYPGWYPYPFYNWYWSPLDIIVVDALLFDHWHGSYGYYAPQDGYADASFDGTAVDQSAQGWNQDDNWGASSWDSQQGNVGFDGSSSGWDSGGGGFGGGSFDSGSSSVDFGGGGGWDSGSSGGGDSGF